MKTDELMNVIAHDAGMQPVPMARRLLVAMAGNCVFAALALMATIGVRPDIWTALGTWRFHAKLLSVATVLTVASVTARKLSRPESDPRSSVLFMALPLHVLVVAIAAELLNTQATMC